MTNGHAVIEMDSAVAEVRSEAREHPDLSRNSDRLNQVIEALVNLTHDHDRNVHAVTGLCGRLLGADCALYRRLDKGRLLVKGGWQVPPGLALDVAPEGHLCFDVIQDASRRSTMVRDLPNTQYARTDPNVAACGWQTYWGHPVCFGGATLGSLCVLFSHDREPAAEDLRILSLLATAIGQDGERQRAEQALRESEEKYRSIFTHAAVGIYQSTLSQLLVVNPALARMFGFASSESMIANTPEAEALFVHPEQRRRLVLAALESEQYVQSEVEYRRQDGSTFTADLRMRAVRDETHQVKYIEGFVEDITERKRSESDLLKMSRALEQSPVSIVITNRAGQMEYVNPAFSRVTGYTKEEALGKNPRILKSGKMPTEIYTGLWETVTKGRDWRGEILNRAKDGKLFWESVVVSPILDKNGRITHYLSVKENITQRKLLEEQLRQSQKMEGIGQLAGGVAHDFNNILAATLLHLGLLQQNPQIAADIKETLKEVEREALRAANLTRQLLLFSRRQMARVEALEMNELVNELLKMLRRLLGENIGVVLQNCPAPAWIRADAGMIEQVVMNLCINARDAMPKGGTLTLRTSLVDVEVASNQTHPDAYPGRFVCLTVMDTGCGMDEALLQKIFEPFFTTKDVGKGTGLGLATVYGIVKQHEGWVEVESQPGQGSSFRVYLPARPKPAHPMTAREGREEIQGGSETILLVEDEPAVREMVALCLRKLGYSVLEAANGVEALSLWEQRQHEISLLFSDMVMPDTLTGLDLAELMTAQKQNLKVIISSGYSADLAKSSAVLRPETEFLPKPYKTTALAKLVRSVLDKK